MPRSLIAIIVAALLASSAPRATAQVPGPAGTPTAQAPNQREAAIPIERTRGATVYRFQAVQDCKG
jgi:hypothetical protein